MTPRAFAHALTSSPEVQLVFVGGAHEHRRVPRFVARRSSRARAGVTPIPAATMATSRLPRASSVKIPNGPENDTGVPGCRRASRAVPAPISRSVTRIPVGVGSAESDSGGCATRCSHSRTARRRTVRPGRAAGRGRVLRGGSTRRPAAMRSTSVTRTPWRRLATRGRRCGRSRSNRARRRRGRSSRRAARCLRRARRPARAGAGSRAAPPRTTAGG